MMATSETVAREAAMDTVSSKTAAATDESATALIATNNRMPSLLLCRFKSERSKYCRKNHSGATPVTNATTNQAAACACIYNFNQLPIVP